MGLVQKSFSDIITFSRSSNATRIGPTGLVEYAPHNLLTYSQELGTSSGGSTVTANVLAAPDGTVTADKITGSTTYWGKSVSITSGTITFSIFLKSSGDDSIDLYIYDGGYTTATVNLANGTITGGTIQNVGNGWYRCSLTKVISATVSEVGLTGISASGVNAWGAQLSVGPYALDYTPTTSAAVYGPRFDYDGSGVTIVEPVSRNLLTYSEDFTNAAWVKTVAGDTVTANAGVAPDGTTTADNLVADTTSSGGHRIYQSVSTSGVHTLSVYAKAAGYSSLVVTSTANNWVYFNLAAGTVSSSLGTGWSAATITDAGNGWYRCTATTSNSNTAYFIGVFNGVGTNGNSPPTFAGNGTDGILIWGAQLEVGSTATGYMVSGATNGFRAVPVVSGSATPRGLLVEEQRTNLLTYSEQFDNAAWSKGNVTATANATSSPDGTVTADQITVTATVNNNIYQSGGSLAATQYTVSFFAKAGTSNWMAIEFSDFVANANGRYFDLSSAAVGGSTGLAVGSTVTVSSASATNVGNGWVRCSVTFSLSSATTYSVLVYIVDGNNSKSVTNGRTIFLWGAQLEAGSFATSYIPTLASTVTRSADVASVNTLSPWYNNTEGTFLFDFNQVGTSAIALIGDDTFNNSLRFNIVNMARGTGTGFTNLVTLGTSQNGSRKLSVAMKVNDYAGSFDGGAVSTQTTASMVPASTVLGIGRDYGTSGYMNGWMRRLAYYPRRLTNAEIQALTA